MDFTLLLSFHFINHITILAQYVIPDRVQDYYDEQTGESFFLAPWIGVATIIIAVCLAVRASNKDDDFSLGAFITVFIVSSSLIYASLYLIFGIIWWVFGID